VTFGDLKLGNLKLGVRLMLGFAVLGVGTLLAAGAGWFGIERQSALASRVVEQDVKFALAVANIRNGVQMLRGHEKDMLANVTSPAASRKYWEQWTEARGRLNDLVGQAGAAASSDAERAGLTRLSGAIQKYESGMQGLYAEVSNKTIAVPEQGYQRVAEFAQAIKDTEEAATGLLESAARDVDALKPALETNARRVALILAGVTLLAMALAALIALFIARSVTVPVAAAMRVAEALARGDLTKTVEVHSTDELGRLMLAMRGTVEQLAGIVGRIKQTSDSVSSASREIAQSHSDLSSRTEEQASALEETSASMQQMTATVGQNAENAKKANQLAAQASGVAEKGGEVVKQAVGTMNGITESSKKIADIIGVIDGIAFQTNILALNAAVEAARAGEQGRGFAVVASEVRSLAQRSAAAAKEIKDLITDSVAKVDAGSRQVHDAGKTMEEIVVSVKKVTGLIAEITAASQEQAQGIEQVSETMTQLERVTQQNAAMVEEASAAAGSLEDQSKALAGAVSAFQLGSAAVDRAQPLELKKPVAVTAKKVKKPVAVEAKKPTRDLAAMPVRAKKGNGHLQEGWQEF
jgi:methyl-accepting chemotaxis protein